MSELEDLIRAKAKSGLHGITLWPSPKGWQGNVRYNSDGWRVEHHSDPVEALLAALRSDENFDHTKAENVPAPTSGSSIFD